MADTRLTDVEAQRKTALAQSDKTYDNMIKDSDSYYQAQIDASKQWANQQAQIQQQKTDFAIEQIEQQKEQTTKEYKKEQSGAYVDWQKQSNAYGVNAEQMASAGLMNSGYSESSQVSMYNTYQNRYATAKEAYTLAIQNYNNQITEARLQNNAILAEIAYNALQQQLELSLQGFQYKNSLVEAKIGQQNTINSRFDSKYESILDQIYKEQALAEEKRQFDILNAPQEIVSYKGGGGSSGESSSNKSSGGRTVSSKVNGNAVSTAYYQGLLNIDAKKYGTFSNGYQPKGISGHGKLTKTGEKVHLQTSPVYGSNKGQKQTLIQNAWKAEDGTKWYWEGRENKYKRL